MRFASKPRSIKGLVFAAVILGIAGPGAGQSYAQAAASTPPETHFEYEVATIKLVQPNSNGPMRIGLMNTPDGFTTENATLQMLITYAYQVQNYQLQGGPAFLTTDHYNIDAKMDADTVEALKKMSSNDERNAARQQMMRTLLADRFQLTIHRESKELPIYNLVVGKNGVKMAESKPLPPPPADADEPKSSSSSSPNSGFKTAGGGRGGPSMMMSGGHGGTMTMTGNSMPIASLVRMLSNSLGRPVLDKTGLTANYDFKLEYTRDELMGGAMPAINGGGGGDGGPAPVAPPESRAPTLMTAVQEQLGLKLESAKGPVEILVIDRASKPSDN